MSRPTRWSDEIHDPGLTLKEGYSNSYKTHLRKGDLSRANANATVIQAQSVASSLTYPWCIKQRSKSSGNGAKEGGGVRLILIGA